MIAALNDDLPYDQFVRRQLAGDRARRTTEPGDDRGARLPGPEPDVLEGAAARPTRSIKAVVADEWDEQIDAVGATVPGADGRLRPLPRSQVRSDHHGDYYALAGVFASTQQVDRPLLDAAAADVVRQAMERIDKIEAELTAERQNPEKRRQLKGEIERIKRETPHYDALGVHAVEDARVRGVARRPDKTQVVYHRGEAATCRSSSAATRATAAKSCRGGSSRCSRPPQATPFPHGSGRRELAEAMFSEARPLAARVIVNRVWGHHFGVGLVGTPSDFGQQGEPPSHPELLDDLAARFVAGGWSLKWLHRELMLSAAYRQVERPSGRPKSPPIPTTACCGG